MKILKQFSWVPWVLGSLAIGVLPASAQVLFTDVSVSSGIDLGAMYETPNFHALGPNWIDFNNDGLPDVFEVAGDSDRPPKLFQNMGNGMFADVSSLMGTPIVSEMSGSVFADYDNDGDSDIYVYTDNRILDTAGVNPPDGPPNLLFKNLWIESGQQIPVSGVLFEEVGAAAGVDDLAAVPYGPLPGYRSKAAAWVDLNRDGCVDLYVGHWVMTRGGSDWNRDRLYENNCDGTFTDVTASSGLDDGIDPNNWRSTLASIGAHLDNDLWPDIYAVRASSEFQPFINDSLWKNNADGTVSVTDILTEPTNIGDDAQAGMGIDVADVDLDGDWDVYITDLIDTARDELPRGNVIYKGDGAGFFFDNSIVADGVVGHNSWGTNFFDIDQDGWEDLFVAGMISAPQSFIYMNDQDGTFTDVNGSGMITGAFNLRGSATADYDRDGDVDLAVINDLGPLQLFRNDTSPIGSFLNIRPIATVSNLEGIGTVIEADYGGVTHKRQIKGGSSGHGQDAIAAYFGLGSSVVVDEVRIFWPSGLIDTLTDIDANTAINVVEGSTSSHLWWGFDSASGDFYQPGAVLSADIAHTVGGGGYLGGSVKKFTFDIAGTDEDPLYNSMRTGANFGYQVDNLPAADYELEFLFAEPYVNMVGLRLMDISVEGALALDDFDIVAAAGAGRKAHAERLVTTVLDGSLDVDVQVVVPNRALMSGLKLRRLVFSMNSGGGLEHEANVGFVFADVPSGGVDFGFSGGQSRTWGFEIAGTDDDAVYDSTRAAASFAYRVPGLPDGHYEVDLLFMEPTRQVAGQRTMDITLEGNLLLDDFDIFAAAGARRTAHSETVAVDVTDGELNISFSAVTGGKAIVSGLSVRRMGSIIP